MCQVILKDWHIEAHLAPIERKMRGTKKKCDTLFRISNSVKIFKSLVWIFRNASCAKGGKHSSACEPFSVKMVVHVQRMQQMSLMFLPVFLLVCQGRERHLMNLDHSKNQWTPNTVMWEVSYHKIQERDYVWWLCTLPPVIHSEVCGLGHVTWQPLQKWDAHAKKDMNTDTHTTLTRLLGLSLQFMDAWQPWMK